MTAPVSDYDAPLVVELGPGTGAFTAPIQRLLRGAGRHLAVELNPRLAAPLAARFPGVEVEVADARDLPAVLTRRSSPRCDVVVSGLPWAALPATARAPGLVRVVADALTEDGVYTQFTYAWTRTTGPARRQLAELRAHFAEVRISPVIWANLPPALVYECRRPRRAAVPTRPARPGSDA